VNWSKANHGFVSASKNHAQTVCINGCVRRHRTMKLQPESLTYAM